MINDPKVRATPSVITTVVFEWMARIDPMAALTFATREHSLMEELYKMKECTIEPNESKE